MTTVAQVHPLQKKLQLKSAKKVLFLEAPTSFAAQIGKIASAEILSDANAAPEADFVLWFVKDQAALHKLAEMVLPNLQPEAKLWLAYPKQTAKLKSDLNRDILYRLVQDSYRLEGVMMVAIDETWSAMRFKPAGETKVVLSTKPASRELVIPHDFAAALAEHPAAKQVFEKFAYTHRKEYINWITEAKRPETRSNRITKAIEMLQEGKKSR